MAWENLFVFAHTLATSPRAKVIALHLQSKEAPYAHPQGFNEVDTIRPQSPLNTLKTPIWDVRNVNCTKQINTTPPTRTHLRTSDIESPGSSKGFTHQREGEKKNSSRFKETGSIRAYYLLNAFR